MELSPDFAFRPLPAIENETLQPFPQVASPFGPLAPLVGTWTGRGFNTIWRPNHTPADQDRFLELNLTSDQIEFSEIPGPIPNRGLLQPDINMFGLRYLNQISDANVGAGLHLGGAVLVAGKDLLSGMGALLKGGGGLVRAILREVEGCA